MKASPDFSVIFRLFVTKKGEYHFLNGELSVTVSFKSIDECIQELIRTPHDRIKEKGCVCHFHFVLEFLLQRMQVLILKIFMYLFLAMYPLSSP